MKPRLLFGLLVMALALHTVPTASAQGTTGRLIGAVRDAEGSTLSGVIVVIASPALIGGPRTTRTGPDGTFSIAHLAPGAYTVRFDLPAFQSLELTAVEVALDRATEVLPKLEKIGRLADSITVTTDEPVVDVTRAGISSTYSGEYLDRTSVGVQGRSYLAVVGRAAGADGGSGDPRVFGSTMGENAYYVDGIDTTDPVTATFGATLNFDAIAEISFQTAGFAAEFGRATGGVVNVITKSGGNQFSGTLDARYNASRFNENGAHFNRDANETEFLRPAATLGGPIRHDRLWFFGALDFTRSKSTPAGSALTRTFSGRNGLAKLNWQIDPRWHAVMKYAVDPAEIRNFNAGRSVEPAAVAIQQQGGPIRQAEVSGLLGPALLAELRAGAKRDPLNRFPQSGDLDTPGITDQATGVTSENYANVQFSERDRDEFQASLSGIAARPAGSHEWKLGAGRSNMRFLAKNNLSGGASYLDFNGPINRRAFLVLQEPLGSARFTGALDSAYVQDAWRPLPPLTLQLGMRSDRVRFRNDAGVEISSQHALQPRLGFALDLRGDAKTVLRGSYGTFMSPNGLTLPFYTRTNSAPTLYYAPCSAFFSNAAACSAGGPFGPAGYLASDPLRRDPLGYFKFNEFGVTPEIIEPGLKPMTTTEYTVGIERQFGNRTSVEISYVYKEAHNIFEDTCAENVPRPTADPNEANCPTFEIANLPAAKRDYQGVLLTLMSHPTQWLDLRVSYVYSKSRGSIEYTQNAGADFDAFPTLFVNRYGYLSDDRRHRVRLDGYVRLPHRWSFGIQSSYSSPFPYSQVTPALGDVEYLAPRGSFRGPGTYDATIEIRKDFALGTVKSALIGTILSLLGTEQVTSVCENALGCGSNIPWGSATGFTRPRHYEIGLRLFL
jgi:TonB-dependent receptor-like protein/carboxypeptidase family protein